MAQQSDFLFRTDDRPLAYERRRHAYTYCATNADQDYHADACPRRSPWRHDPGARLAGDHASGRCRLLRVEAQETTSPVACVAGGTGWYNPPSMVIDFHTHVFPPWLRARREEYLPLDATFGALYASPKAVMATAEELIASMDGAGVDVSVTAGIGWTDPELARRCNDYLLESAARYPKRLVALCGASPSWGESVLAAEMERCAKGGARGVGELHPDSQRFDLANPEATATLMEKARRLGLFVLTHSSEPVGHQYPGKGSATPDVLLAFIQAYPQNTIVAAHWGGGLPFYALMPEVGTALANVYFDTAASPFLYQPRIFKLAPDAVGYGRVLFGSDFPLLAQARVLRQLREAGLPPEDEAAIAGGNAARLLTPGSDRG